MIAIIMDIVLMVSVSVSKVTLDLHVVSRLVSITVMIREIARMESVFVDLIITEKHVRNSIVLINAQTMVIVIIRKEDVSVILVLKDINVKYPLVLIIVMAMVNVSKMQSVSAIHNI